MEKLTSTSSVVQMVDIWSIFALAIIVLLVTKYLMNGTLSPPGPWGLPFIGHLLFLGKDHAKQFQRYREEFGDVYQLRLGVWPTVIISGYHTVKKVLSEQSDSFAARPAFNSFKFINKMRGLTFSYFDQRYLLHRKIASTVLKEYSSRMEEIMQEEANRIVSDFLNENGRPFNPNKVVTEATGSIIYQFCYGKGENIREDKDFLELLENHKNFKEMAKAANPTDVLPWTQIFFQEKVRKFHKFIRKAQHSRAEKFQDILETFDPKHMRHAVDGIISTSIRYGLEDEPNEVGLTKQDVFTLTGDFFGGGFDNTSTTLCWLLLYMAEYPVVQATIQREIDNVIGQKGIILLEDREKMPFTEATIFETMRLSGVVPLGLPHCATEDVLVNRYVIKKGTLVFFNHYSVGHDKEWGDPFEFRPERFLDSGGKLMREKTESVLAFSIGRRRCPGETLARNELFLLFATVLCKCDISKPEHENYDFEGNFSLTYSPKPYNIYVCSKEN